MFLNQFFKFSYPSKKPFSLVMLHFPAISAEKRGKMLQKQNGEEKKMSEINWYNDNIYRLLIFIIFRSLMMVWPATAEHHFVMFDPWSALRQYFITVLFYQYVVLSLNIMIPCTLQYCTMELYLVKWWRQSEKVSKPFHFSLVS